MIDIRRFRRDEAPALMGFIDEHWAKGHVLARRRDLLEWQHGDGDALAYFGAWQDGELLAVLGYIPTRRYDPELAGSNVNWLALWKLREDVRAGGLGMRLLAALAAAEPQIATAVVGINPEHLPMYAALGYRTGALTQHAIFRPGADLGLANWPGERPTPKPGRAALEPLSPGQEPTLAIGERASALPRKSAAYFENRYLRHPFYDYAVHAVVLDGERRGLLASRVASAPQGDALRLVDFYGDETALAQCGSAVLALLEETGAEYADFWQYGLAPGVLDQAGFAVVEAPRVVPSLFEPFAPASRPLHFAFKAPRDQPVVVMRGDGDQDRPNLLAAA